jgi:hypothetical protein
MAAMTKAEKTMKDAMDHLDRAMAWLQSVPGNENELPAVRIGAAKAEVTEARELLA